MTAAGRDAALRGAEGARRLEEEIFGELSAHERETLSDMLSRVLARLADVSSRR